MGRPLCVALVGLLGTVLLAGCGDADHGMSDGTGSGSMHHDVEESRPVVPGARELPVRADSLTFAPQKLDMRAGENVTIALTSVDLAHDFEVEDIGHVVHARRGATRRGGLKIEESGTYDFWCTVNGHREGGMVGTIRVSA